jgi:fucokinase
LPLAQATQASSYLADTSDGPATPGLVAARRKIWPHLRDLQFSVERLQPAVFVHFGTSAEYWRMVATDRELAQTSEWATHAAAWLPTLDEAAQAQVVAINAALGALPIDPTTAEPSRTPGTAAPAAPAWQFNAALLLVDSHLAQPIVCAGAAIIAGVHTARSFTLDADRVLHQLPVQDGYVTRLIGLHDDPKQLMGKPHATYLHQPWADFLAALDEPPATLWPHLPPEAHSLWTAHLFPLVADREESLALTLGLQDPAQAGAAWKQRWRQAPRCSLAASFAQANSRRLLDEMAQLEDAIAASRLLDEIVAETPAAVIAAQTRRWDARLRERRLHLVAAPLSSHPPLLQVRAYRALAEAAGDARLEDRAFAVLAHLIEADTRRRVGALPHTTATTLPQGRGVRVAAAARIDFGGGWTDTPPYSLELGGQVLNAAVTLRNHHPIVAEAAWLDEPRLLLDARDIDEAVEPRTAGEILAYANPVDPFALLKAALVITGIVPINTPPATPLATLLRPYGRGLRVSTQTNIPRGSGLGTSSIMAGAVLAALGRLVGRTLDDATLFDQVLSLEQMLTTGGGWQDQVGGLVGGIHLVTSSPGLPQQLNVRQVEVSPMTASALTERLCLVYTGQQRLAKNLLRAVVSRWMARDPEMVSSLVTLAGLAEAMHQALRQDDLDQFGRLLTAHWQINQRMDSGCTNPFIDGLFRFMQPYMSGCKLAGAGGGGFAIVMTHDAAASAALGQALATHYANTGVALWPSAIATDGLVVTQL